MVQGLNSRPRDFLGSGFSYPVRVSVQGGIQLSAAEQDIAEAIWIILRTEVGERVYRPTFGCRLSELTFAPMNTRTLFLMRLYVEEALRLWEPRIVVEEVRADPDPVSGRVDLVIDYRIRQTNSPANMVYPFYLMTQGGF